MTAQAGIWELQKGILAKLAADSSIKALLGDPARIYDVPPADPTFPFILIGEMVSEDAGARDTRVERVSASIQSFANQNRGSGDIKKMGVAIKAVLDNADIPLAAGSVVFCQYNGTTEEETKDGLTWMGTTKFTILLDTTS